MLLGAIAEVERRLSGRGGFGTGSAATTGGERGFSALVGRPLLTIAGGFEEEVLEEDEGEDSFWDSDCDRDRKLRSECFFRRS